jgi:hypothetical protein
MMLQTPDLERKVSMLKGQLRIGQRRKRPSCRGLHFSQKRLWVAIPIG